jgi:hypothetical protein
MWADRVRLRFRLRASTAGPEASRPRPRPSVSIRGHPWTKKRAGRQEKVEVEVEVYPVESVPSVPRYSTGLREQLCLPKT